MTDAEIIRLVEEVRRLQRQFWRLNAEARPPDLLRQCKAVEKRLDEALAARRDGQGRLFGSEGS